MVQGRLRRGPGGSLPSPNCMSSSSSSSTTTTNNNNTKLLLLLPLLLLLLLFRSRAAKIGWHYLSNATCLMRPHLFMIIVIIIIIMHNDNTANNNHYDNTSYIITMMMIIIIMIIVFYGIACPIRLVESATFSPLLRKACVIQVVLDKWSPLNLHELRSSGSYSTIIQHNMIS